MAGDSKHTTNHNQIKRWAEARKGKPAVVKDTHQTKSTGIIRLAFPTGRTKKALEEISWDEFFDMFENNKLAMVYQEKTKTGRQSRFSKFVNRDSVKKGSQTSKSSGKSKSQKTEKATASSPSAKTVRNRAPEKRTFDASRKKTTVKKSENTEPEIQYIDYTSPDTSSGEIRRADDPRGGEFSGIPGTGLKGDLGDKAGGSTAGTKGRGSASHGSPGGGVPED